MATKKQKRLAGEKRQAVNRQQSIDSGLKAQKKANDLREKSFKDAARAKERRDKQAKLKKNADGTAKAIRNVGREAQNAADSMNALNEVYDGQDYFEAMDEFHIGPVDDDVELTKTF